MLSIDRGRWPLRLACAAGLFAAAGPAMAKPDAAVVAACQAGAPAGLEAVWRPMCAAEAKDLTLHRMRAAQAALAAGHRAEAERLFDAVLAAIEAVYAESEAATKALSVWNAESVNDFKGEPYERVMAYYYRGLLYLMAGDWDNAQASFRGGVLQDSFAGQERYRADVASLLWLAGWAARCSGSGTAADLFAEAAEIRPALQPPPPDLRLLVVAETGIGPRKVAIGAGNETLAYREGMLGNDRLVAVVGGRTAPMAEAEDLFFQATSRGGRQMDEVLADKLTTQQTTRAAGEAAMVAGTSTMAVAQAQPNNNGSGAAAVGGAIALIGMIVYASSQSMDTRADTRTWESLPHSLHLAALPAPSGALRGESVDLRDGAGASVLATRTRVQIATAPACSLAWIGAEAILPSRPRPAPVA
ncbi:MAG: hypothetical protein HY985_17865, partial [Magnetospirillum sp.]|nr:hypothetical protein [Magnetospirillum sp.]